MCNEVRAALCVIVIRGIEHGSDVPGCHVLSFCALRGRCVLFDLVFCSIPWENSHWSQFPK